MTEKKRRKTQAKPLAEAKDKKVDTTREMVSTPYVDPNDKPQDIKDFLGSDFNVSSAYSAVYTEAVKTRKDFVKKFDEIKSFYIVDAILTIIADDALAPDTTTGEVLNISSTIPKIDKQLKILQKRFDIDSIVRDITIDLMSNGEHTLSITSDKDGVVIIDDDVDQKNIVAFYKQGYPLKFIKKEARGLAVYDATNFAHFSIDRYKLRVNTVDEFGSIASKQLKNRRVLPKYARVGRPILYGVLSKIKELKLLEQLVPASRLNQIMSGNTVLITVPETTEPKEAMEIARQYEQFLNRKTGVDASGDITVSDIISSAGRHRVIPTYTDGKGGLESVAAKDNAALDNLIDNIRDTREIICTSVGVPPEILFGSENDNKGQLLKKYSRYLRKLKIIQSAITHGVKQIVYIHFGAQGLAIGLDDINVQFKNSLINIDELEKEEFKEVILDSIKNVHEFVSTLTNDEINISEIVDIQKYKDWVKSRFTIIGGGLGDFINPNTAKDDLDQEPKEDISTDPNIQPDQ